MKLHPIVDFQALFPEAFNTLIKEHMQDLEKYRHGSWVCDECDAINVLYYANESQTYMSQRETVDDKVQRNCECCGAYYKHFSFSHMGALRK